MIGSVWGLLVVGRDSRVRRMAVLWCVQVRISDASHVDVAWAVLIACAAILYAVLADGDVAHRVLAAVLASLWGFRLGGYLYFNRIRGKDGGRPLPGAPPQVGREREPELLRLLPGTGALRRLLLAPVRVHRARSGLELRRSSHGSGSRCGRSGTSGRSSRTASSRSGARIRRTRARPPMEACGAGHAIRTTSSSG